LGRKGSSRGPSAHLIKSDYRVDKKYQFPGADKRRLT
jgi:hypothetical protein